MPFVTIFIFSFFGLFFFIFGMYTYFQLIKKSKNGIQIEACIIERELRKIKDSDFSSFYYFYKLEYPTRSGIMMQSWSTEGTSKKREIGEVTPIIYDPNNEQEFILWLDEQKRLFLLFTIMGFISLLFALGLCLKQY